MRKFHQLFAVVLAACALSMVVPASAAQGMASDRQTSATTGAVEHSNTKKAAERPHQTAQLSRSAKGKAIRRAIAVRRARAAKAKKAASS